MNPKGAPFFDGGANGQLTLADLPTQSLADPDNAPSQLLADTKSDVSTQYDSVMNMGVAKLSARHTFLIDPQGKVEKVWLDVKPANHSEEVLAALTQLQSGSGN